MFNPEELVAYIVELQKVKEQYALLQQEHRALQKLHVKQPETYLTRYGALITYLQSLPRSFLEEHVTEMEIRVMEDMCKPSLRHNKHMYELAYLKRLAELDHPELQDAQVAHELYSFRGDRKGINYQTLYHLTKTNTMQEQQGKPSA